MRAFADDHCTHVFPAESSEGDLDGVPPMDAADIRTMLLTELDGPARQRLLGKDRDSPDSQEVVNSFIAKVAAYSQGLPLYVRFVIGEVKARGTLRHFDPTDLPKSIEKFYTRLIQRSTVGVLQQITTPLVTTLAVAKEPLGSQSLLTLLRDRKTLDPSPSDEQARRQVEYVMQALAIVAPLLRTATTPDDEVGYTLTHHSLREFVTDPDRCREMHEPVVTAEKALLEACSKAALLDSPARMYLIRNAIDHLIKGKCWNGVEQLLTDIFFLEAKTKAGLVFELVNDFTLAAAAMPADRKSKRILRLLDEAIRRDIHFIARHAENYPQALFQCLWNNGWWYDCEEAGAHYRDGCAPGLRSIEQVQESGETAASGPPEQLATNADDQELCRLLEYWRRQKNDATPEFPWLCALRPPRVPLGSAQLAIFRGHEDCVTSVAFSPDGQSIISASGDGTVRIWDVQNGVELNVLRGHNDWVTSATCSVDGERIASGSRDNTVRVWNMRSGAELLVLRGHEDDVDCVAFALDGQRIVSGSKDGTVRVWDARSGAGLFVLCGHEGDVNCVAFAPDGERIVSGSWDNTLRMWDAQRRRASRLSWPRSGRDQRGLLS